MPVVKLTAFVVGVVGVGLGGLLGLAGCGDDDDPVVPDAPVSTSTFAVIDCTKVTTAHCVEVKSDDEAALRNAANTIEDNTTLVLGSGTFKMTGQVTIRNKGTHIIGQGMDMTTLDFGKSVAQSNGVDVQGDGFLIQDLTVLDAPKDGIRVEDTDGVVYRRIRATWTDASQSTNGAYGIYPVKSKNVLVEDSRAENAADAGLYVGQCQNVIVRRNTVRGNVAGLEIENTQYADVYENTAEDNTGGIVVFDLPHNPIVGRDVRIRNNIIRNNNHVNFAAGGTVAYIPVGTGTFAMASRRVEITGNTYENNHTTDISVISGLTIEDDLAQWSLETASLVGSIEGLELASLSAGTVANFGSNHILIANNTHAGSGADPDTTDDLMLGLLLKLHFGDDPIASVLYDAVGEPEYDPEVPANNSNDNVICVGGNTNGTFASMALDKQATNPTTPFYRPAAPFAPFQCTELDPPVAAVVLP